MAKIQKALISTSFLALALAGCGGNTVTEVEVIKNVNVEVASNVQLGDRPAYLISKMADGELKSKLQSCQTKVMKVSDFSIGHRGAAMQFPEHSKESYEAAIRQGAGIVECDVAFTKDMELVCRHAQNDLHTTTNILTTPLASNCTKPFTPAVLDTQGKVVTPASAECRTSDITLAEFKTLRAKMDDKNPAALTAKDYLVSTNTQRTDVYASSGTLMTHKESIALIKAAGRKFTPELKTPTVAMPYTYNGKTYTQEDYAKQMIQEYIDAGVPPAQVYAQSFLPADIYYWIKTFPDFGKQAVYLDDYDSNVANIGKLLSGEKFVDIANKGVKYVGTALPKILTLDANQKMIASQYTKDAKAAGLNMIAWTVERSLPINATGWYYQSVAAAMKTDGDNYPLIDALNKEAGVKGIFSDWPATVTYYANCMGL